MHKSLIVILLPLLLIASGQGVAQTPPTPNLRIAQFSNDYLGRQLEMDSQRNAFEREQGRMQREIEERQFRQDQRLQQLEFEQRQQQYRDDWNRRHEYR
jgi:hypothetical protein